MRKQLLTILIGGTIVTAAFNAEACSRLLWDTDQGIFVSRTLDWMEATRPTLENYPVQHEYTLSLAKNADTAKAKYAVTGIAGYGGLLADAYNQKGLGGNILFFSPMELPEEDDSDAIGSIRLLQHIVSQYATVAEAVAAIPGMKLREDGSIHSPVSLKIHYSLQDVSGDSAIIEMQDGEVKIWHGRQYTVMTNQPDFQQHLNNLQQAQSQWGHADQHSAKTRLGTAANINPEDRFVHNHYFLSHLKEPTSIINGIAKLESATFKIPHDAPNRKLKGKMTAYATEYTVTTHPESGTAYMRYQWGDSYTQFNYNFKELQATGKRISYPLDGPLLSGDITEQVSNSQ
ncbi:MAG: linear amide C-N hydrolase [Pseudomonadales bacterium]|nr:linear amide C-N hydrolase [Pseudomonadales bacterium]